MPELPLIVSSVPKNLKYVQQRATHVADYWEQELGVAPPKIRVRPTFVVDASNPRTLKTAMKWAGSSGVKVTELPNDPIPVVELVTLEIRGEGGRAWKALVHGLYYVDLREDVLRDALVYGNGCSNKELVGPFIWSSVSGQMKLIRVGSAIHQAVERYAARTIAPNLNSADLELGGVYKDARGDFHIYLGQVDADYIDVVDHQLTGHRARNVQLWWGQKWYTPHQPRKLTLEDIDTYHLRAVKKASVKGKVGTVKIPEGMFAHIQAKAVKALGQAKTATRNQYKHAQSPWYKLTGTVEQALVGDEGAHFRWAHIRPAGTVQKAHPKFAGAMKALETKQPKLDILGE